MKCKKPSFYLSSLTLLLISFHIDVDAQNISLDEIQDMVGAATSKETSQQNDTVQQSGDLSKPKKDPASLQTQKDLSLKRVVEKPKDFNSIPERKKLDQTLEKFGYNLFADAPTTFAPATDIPIPFDYVIGPGDTIKAILYGGQSGVYDLQVSREGEIYFPAIGGPLAVAGLSFLEMKNVLSDRIKSQTIGVNVSITLGKLRSIRIFILGEAYQPGSYTVSALSTLTNALFVSGGVRETGSLRDIELKRQGKVISQFDFYDLLLNGDTSDDVRLQPGDVIFIPPIGQTAGISGEARRPYVYELRAGDSAKDLIHYAGGLNPTADLSSAQIERITTSGSGLTLVDVDLSSESALSQQLNDGDLLYIYPVLNTMQDVVLLTGYAQRPGFYQWKKGMRISDLINLKQDLLPQTDRNYVLIKRENNLSGNYEALQLDLDEIIQSSDTDTNIILSNRDEIFFFSKKYESSSRDKKQKRDSFLNPEEEPDVTSKSKSKSESDKSKKLESLLEESGDITDLVDPLIEMVVIRDQTDIGKGFAVEIIDKKLWDIYEKQGYVKAEQDEDLITSMELEVAEEKGHRNKLIEPFLELLRQQASPVNPLKTLIVGGNVYFPGEYPLTQNMSLNDAIKAAGGLKESAFMEGIELTRRTLIDNEYLVTRKKIPGIESSTLQTAVQANDIVLVKTIPEQSKTVEIKGEVYFPGIYPIEDDDTLLTLIERAGGVKDTAFVSGAIFHRESIQQAEILRLKSMKDILMREIVLGMTQVGVGTEGQSDNSGPVTTMLGMMEDREINEETVVGRLVLDLEGILNKRVPDIILDDKDVLLIPRDMQSVSVLGEVYVPSAHVFSRGLSITDYIELGGGPTQFADMSNSYLIKANGAVITDLRSSKFFRGSERLGVLQPGDTIVVPLKTNQLSSIATARGVTEIIYQMSLAAAAVNSFSN